MKKLSAIVLAVAMVVSMAACGSGGASGGGATTQAPAATQAAPAETQAPAATQAAPADTQAPAAPAPAAPAPAAQGPKEVKIGWLGTNSIVNPYDPALIFTMSNSGAVQDFLIYDKLFYYEGGEPHSRILESWEWTDDLTLVMKLKDGIYFSNGDQLLGDDVLYTYASVIAGNLPIKFMFFFIDIENSTVSDDGLTITMKTHDITPYALTFLTVGILDKDYIEGKGGGANIDWYDPAQQVGSGPYKPVEYVPDNHSVFQLREDYWGFAHGYQQNIDKITVQLYGDATTMMADYENGNIDLAWNVTATDYDTALGGGIPNTGAGIVTNNFVSWLVMDVDDQYFSDPAVREAVCSAIDVAALTKSVRGSLGAVGTGALAVNMLGHTEDFQYTYDPDHAKQVLADAGYKDGQITVTYAYKSADPVQSQTAQLVQAYLMAIGMNVTLKALDEATYSSEESVEGYSSLAYYFMSNGADDPGQFMANWRGDGMNAVMNRHGIYDELILKAQGTQDIDVRVGAYYELQKLWYENFDMVPLYEIGIAYLYNTNVFESCELKGFSTNLLEMVAK
ncbi:MAG: ABC transporter substrate-binding protein [Lachnospiraceae bacterium]|jgi:peptide/nickel transport system substrate-binding protein|nr:ABC transporter substrate-binding protein [Lachnospiraceae bacterium]